MGKAHLTVDDRRAQILRAALAVFARKGFDAATNKDIARAAGITPGLIYHYFKNKRDLLVEAMELHSPVKAMRSVTPEMLALPPGDLLPRILRELLDVLEGDEFLSMLRVFLPEAIHKGTMSPSVFSAMTEATGFLQRYLEDRMKAGQLRPADAALTSHLVIGSLMDLVLRRRVIRDRAVLKFSRQQIVDHVVSTTLEGLLPR
ncbi:MAG TPA: TetR/AcrR family transcriptional regulator [Spirochaetia bacterium]|nr:TetR/AcrR family transcriptional regulator [Spirochaetia bacterium]